MLRAQAQILSSQHLLRSDWDKPWGLLGASVAELSVLFFAWKGRSGKLASNICNNLDCVDRNLFNYYKLFLDCESLWLSSAADFDHIYGKVHYLCQRPWRLIESRNHYLLGYSKLANLLITKDLHRITLSLMS